MDPFGENSDLKDDLNNSRENRNALSNLIKKKTIIFNYYNINIHCNNNFIFSFFYIN